MTGLYDVTVTYEGLPVHGSPVQICVCDPSAILVSSVPYVLLGCPVEFTGQLATLSLHMMCVVHWSASHPL